MPHVKHDVPVAEKILSADCKKSSWMTLQGTVYNVTDHPVKVIGRIEAQRLPRTAFYECFKSFLESLNRSRRDDVSPASNTPCV